MIKNSLSGPKAWAFVGLCRPLLALGYAISAENDVAQKLCQVSCRVDDSLACGVDAVSCRDRGQRVKVIVRLDKTVRKGTDLPKTTSIWTYG